MTFPTPPADTVWACPSCSRWLTPENPQHGSRCAGCVAEANRVWDDVEHPVAYHPVGYPVDCAGCGQTCEGPGTDLCWGCDPFVKF